MTSAATPATNRVAIACGGTGGHLFPGLAVAGALMERGCKITLLISPKEIDQQGVKGIAGMEIVTLPAVGLTRGRALAFLRGFRQSYLASKRAFAVNSPSAALAMGGFTSAPPILAAKRYGAKTFLHESNSIPGRASRWLSWIVDRSFIGFPSAQGRLHNRRVSVVGTPVRPQFKPADAESCRKALGLEPARPVILVTGGSQGASGINQLVAQALPCLGRRAAAWQWFHLTGPADVEKTKAAYRSLNLTASVHPFLADMHLAMGAATAAIARAGASSIAELAAMRLPSVLIPYPAATDNHQFHNAQALVQTGAARMLEQSAANPGQLAALLTELVENPPAREKIQSALAQWHAPQAAEQMAEQILAEAREAKGAGKTGATGCSCCSGQTHKIA